MDGVVSPPGTPSTEERRLRPVRTPKLLYWTRKLKSELGLGFREGTGRRDKELVKHAYAADGDRDLRLYFDHGVSKRFVYDGRLVEGPPEAVRDRYVRIIADRLDPEMDRRVLEVGAGTSLNLHLLQEILGGVSFYGIDLVEERVRIGLEELERRGRKPNTVVGDATAMPFPDRHFDVLFSVHCFEQMERYVEAALSECLRVTRRRMIFLEPDWRSSNVVQRMFLRRRDYLRDFEGRLAALAGSVVHVPLDTYYNPLNRTGMYIVDVDGDGAAGGRTTRNGS